MYMLTNDDLKAIKGIVTNEIVPIQKELKKHGKLLRSLKKDQDTMLNMLDKEQMTQRKQLKKIEDHLGFSPTAL